MWIIREETTGKYGSDFTAAEDYQVNARKRGQIQDVTRPESGRLGTKIEASIIADINFINPGQIVNLNKHIINQSETIVFQSPISIALKGISSIQAIALVSNTTDIRICFNNKWAEEEVGVNGGE